MNTQRTDDSRVTEGLPKESSIAKRSRELMQTVAELHGRPYVEMPPRIPRRSAREIERTRELEQADSHEVYFLYSCNRVKIGTSRHHQRRVLQDISPYCPAPLFLLGAVPGGPIVEGRLHERFADALIRNEWFELTSDLRSFLMEDEDRADRLDAAEDDYVDWLEDELQHQRERQNVNRGG